MPNELRSFLIRITEKYIIEILKTKSILKGAILKPCGPLGGRGVHEKSTSVHKGGGEAIGAVHVDQIY